MYIDTLTGAVVAVLTRRGRELLATDSSNFTITQFAFGDDEIYYPDYNGLSPDAVNTAILSTPILEPASENLSPLRWGIATLPINTTTVADLEIDTILNINLNQSITF